MGEDDGRDPPEGDERRAPFRFVYELPTLVRRYVMAELLAPPLALRRSARPSRASGGASRDEEEP
jgi:hypothetical protein